MILEPALSSSDIEPIKGHDHFMKYASGTVTDHSAYDVRVFRSFVALDIQILPFADTQSHEWSTGFTPRRSRVWSLSDSNVQNNPPRAQNIPMIPNPRRAQELGETS
jgi:hypothetical protein